MFPVLMEEIAAGSTTISYEREVMSVKNATMKRWMCVMLALVFSMGGCAAWAEPAGEADEWVAFNASLTNAMDYSADDWISTDTSRAMLTLLLILDIGLSGTTELDIGNVFIHDTYVGADDDEARGVLLIAGQIDGKAVTIAYAPATHSAEYTLAETGLDESGTDSVLNFAMRQVCGDAYYRNDPDELSRCADELQSGLLGD